jgi:hypothetical protein
MTRRKKKTNDLTQIIQEVAATHTPNPPYALDVDPKFWGTVFVLHFGEYPKGDNDTRWDLLFRKGYPIFHELFGNFNAEIEINTFEKASNCATINSSNPPSIAPSNKS